MAAAVAALDQLAKMLVVRGLGPEQPRHAVDVVGGLLRFHYVENRGAAFGVLRGWGVLLGALAVVVLVGLVVAYRRLAAGSLPIAVGIGLVGGGAVGNLVDRVRLGFVVDFVAVGPWPKFNVADAAITVGVVVLAVAVLHDEPSPERTGLPADGAAAAATSTETADG